ncbi:MAG: tagatose-6-phosphate ketose isomerase [Acidobacteriaceae bacterium]
MRARVITVDPLSTLLRLPASEKLERGLQHTPQEIAQQPGTWRRTLDRLRSQRGEFEAFLASTGLRDQPERRPTVFLVGAGTSDYIGRSLHPLLRRCWQCEVIPVASTSLLPDFSDSLVAGRRYLWISFSRSGNSPEGVAVLERALEECPQISHLLVSCNGSGRMMQAIEGRPGCHTLVLDDEVNDRGLAMTSSFTNMVLTGQFLAHLANPAAYAPIVDALATAAESLLPHAAHLASDLVREGYSRVCFLGSGGLAGAAMESALKVLELTAGRVQTMSQATLALRHGPMAALDHDTLLVAFISSQAPRRNYELDLLREIGAKGLVRTRVAVAADPAGLDREAEHILAPEAAAAIPDACRPMLDVIFGQLLGLFASIHAGLQPDTPSPTGAISRVVPELSIY